MNRAYYFASIDDFCDQEPDQILGQMAREHSFDLNGFQRDAWMEQSKLLKDVLYDQVGKVYFEFSIPRMGRRIDAVVIIGSAVFVIEFKVGAGSYKSADIDQVMDYALDLRNFHEGSHQVTLVPIVVATKAQGDNSLPSRLPKDGIFLPIRCNAETLHGVITAVLDINTGHSIDCKAWESSGYKPTPTIIEATLALYNGHSVSEISRNDANTINLSRTSNLVSEIIAQSRKYSEKSIIFVTGVPGSGKTLVGLNIATTHIDPSDELYSVYLSGNGPLVKVLQEALARDKVLRKREVGEKIR